MLNEALLYQDYETIGGEKIMAPAANLIHSKIIVRLLVRFENYFFQNQNGHVFADDVDVHFPDGSIYKPDLVVVSKENAGILNWHKAIFGAPDMVVEIISKSTKNRDYTIKKDTYEKFGVKEYWIIDPFIKSVTVYLLREGKYELDDEYVYISKDEYEYTLLTDEEKAEWKYEVKVSIFENLSVKLEDIFSWGY